MTTSLSLQATLQFQPTDASRPAPVPVVISQLQYSQLAQFGLVFTSPQTNVLLGEGTISSPKFIYIEVVSGEIDFTPSSTGLNPIKIVANPTPAAGDVSACMLVYTQGTPGPFYVTTPGPATARVWFIA